MKPPSLTAEVRSKAWDLLLGAAVADGRNLGAPALAAAQALFEAGDRRTNLALVLSRAALASRTYDQVSRAAFVAVGDLAPETPGLSPGEAEAARRAAVRCDAVLKEYVADRVEWYREALRGGSSSAAALLTIGALSGQLAPDEETAAAVRSSLAELSHGQWRSTGFGPDQARTWLANWYTSSAGPAPTAEARSLVRAALRAEPANAVWLAWLASNLRPSLAPASVEIYHALFEADPGNRANTDFLAGALTAGDITLDNPAPVLEAWVQANPAEAPAARQALAESALRTQREDDAALGWLREVVAEGRASSGQRAWLAMLLAAREASDEASLALYQAVLGDEQAPAEWRGTAGLALLRAEGEHGAPRLERGQLVWSLLPADERPDELALSLAEHYQSIGQTDGAAAAVYQRAYRLNPSPKLAELLAVSYLHDDATPIRAKVEHWRVCLDHGWATQAVLEALAKAYVPLGPSTNAAIEFVQSAPPEQRHRLLDDLCRYRFRRADYAAAEALAAAMLRLAPASDPAEQAADWAKLATCKVRRALAEGRDLALVDLGEATAYADQPVAADLACLLETVRGADGSPDSVDLVPALRRAAPERPVVQAAAAALAGGPAPAVDLTTSDVSETWLLALTATVSGQAEAAAALLARLPKPLREAGLALMDGPHSEDPCARLARLLPAVHRQGPPWDQLRAATLSLAVRCGSADQVAALAGLLSEEQALAAELRLVAETGLEDPAAAVAAAARLETATDPVLSFGMLDGLLERQAHALLEAGDLTAAQQSMERLAEHGQRTDRPRDDRALADAGHWLGARLAMAAGETARAWDHIARLTTNALAQPVVAWSCAAWHLAAGQPARADSALGQALAVQPNDVELLYGSLALNAMQGRRDAAVGLAERVLAGLPEGDPRHGPLQLMREICATEVEQIDATKLLSEPDGLTDEAIELHLQLVMAVAAAQLRAHEPALAAATLRGAVSALRHIKRPALGATLSEVHNLRAYCHYLSGEPAEAQRLLGRLTTAALAVGHNKARVAAEAGESGVAVDLWTQLTDQFEALPLEDVAPGYTEAALYAWRMNLAEMLLNRSEWRTALAHLEACLALRPYDIEAQRKCIPALIAVGEGEVALYKSDWLVKERPRDLEILLDHGMVLASVRGTRTGLDYYDELLVRRPDATEAVRAKRRELRSRLADRGQELAREGDHVTLFTLARELEALAETDEERAGALFGQAYALHGMDDGHGETRLARLEQAAQRLDEALALPANERLREQMLQLKASLEPTLAPELVRGAGELLAHRRREYMSLTSAVGALSPAARQEATSLAAAFDRVADMLERARALSGRPLVGVAADALSEARRLAEASRRASRGEA